MHPRQEIRETVVQLLKDANTTAGQRVYENRMEPLRKQDLPAIIVYTMRERIDPAWDTAPRELKRTTTIAIEAALLATDDVDDELDAMARDIEGAMHVDDTLNGCAADSLLTETEVEIFVAGKEPIGAIRLTYDVTYYTQVPDESDVERDNLNTVDTRYSLENEQAEPEQAHDQIEDLQA